MQYRTDIDGLRAVAVLCVIIFHAFPKALTAGFLGVDIFFVISGYLITAIILEEIDAGTFRISNFFLKRARRILPALFFVIACCTPLAWIWMMPAEYRAFSDSVIASCLSVSNLFFWSKSGYFAPETAQLPLLHTWSLGVEEQFYAVYPFLLRSARIRLAGKFGLSLALVAGLVVSISASYAVSKFDPELGFYMLPTRAWQFLAGGICACYTRRVAHSNGVLAGVGIALVALAVYVFDENDSFPIGSSVAVLGTCLILVHSRGGSLTALVLRSRPLTAIGRMSYSAYLWHQPLFAFARIRSIDSPDATTMFLLVIASLVLAYLTYRLVECPFRRSHSKGSATSKQFIAGLAVVSATLIGFGIYGNVSNGVPSRLPPQISAFIKDNAWNRHCLASRFPVATQVPEAGCTYNPQHETTYAILGDSIASSLSPSLAQELDRHGIALEQVTHSACAPIEGVRSRGESAQGCPLFIRAALDHIKAKGIKTVILAGAWITFFDEESVELNGRTFKLASDDAKTSVGLALQSTVNQLLEAGVKVVLVYPFPRGESQVVARVAKLMLAGDPRPTVSVPEDKYWAQAKDALGYLNDVQGKNVLRVMPAQLFCASSQQKCVLADGGKAYIYDKLHLTPSGAAIVARKIVGDVLR